jgi:Zn-dependent protease with chaperone function
MEQKLKELSKKACLSSTPELYISKHERLASVNVFQRRITVGEYLITQWCEGKFNDADIEATLAHEVGHLMDIGHGSKSSNFRNLIFASMWFLFGTFPLIVYLFWPSIITLIFSVLFAVGWGFSLPRIVRRIDVNVELEADKNAALHLVEPKQLAEALAKISALRKPTYHSGLMTKIGSLIGIITHPTFSERINHLNNLNIISEA